MLSCERKCHSCRGGNKEGAGDVPSTVSAIHGTGTRRAGGKGHSDPCTGISTSITASFPCPVLNSGQDVAAFPFGSLLQFGVSPGSPQNLCWGLERSWEPSAMARTNPGCAGQPAGVVGRGTRAGEGWGLPSAPAASEAKPWCSQPVGTEEGQGTEKCSRAEEALAAWLWP